MTYHSSRNRAAVYQPDLNPDSAVIEFVRHACATKLQEFSIHSAGGGSQYIYAADIKIRFADHINTSAKYDAPDYNCVGCGLTMEQAQEIAEQIDYPRLAKKTTMALHLGLTVPKLKKLLEGVPHAYAKVCENPKYPNTYTEFVEVETALAIASDAGITSRIPIEVGCASFEDWGGGY